MNTKKLIQLREDAERAVADMADGDIKAKAFEVILAHLLDSSEDSPKSTDEEAAPTKRVGKKAAAQAKSAAARVLVLRDEGFFGTQRAMGEISDELAAHGWHYPLTSLSGTLIGLAQRQELRRMQGKKGTKKGWLYSEP